MGEEMLILTAIPVLRVPGVERKKLLRWGYANNSEGAGLVPGRLLLYIRVLH
jgi:hypothetical protein